MAHLGAVQVASIDRFYQAPELRPTFLKYLYRYLPFFLIIFLTINPNPCTLSTFPVDDLMCDQMFDTSTAIRYIPTIDSINQLVDYYKSCILSGRGLLTV